MCLRSDSIVMDAIKLLNESNMNIVFICDSESRLVGTVTDADIRRGLGDGLNVDISVRVIMNKEPVSMWIHSSNSELRKRFLVTKLRTIPLLDREAKVVDYRTIEEFSFLEKKKSSLMIMAGGLGVRMGSLTQNTPKPMLPVKGKPMLQHIIELAVKDGLEQIFISTHYLADQISDYFESGDRFGAKITYIHEEKPLGTAGSFAKLPLEDGICVVTNADIISPICYSKLIDFHFLNTAAATVAVKQHLIEHPFGVVRADGINFIKCEEKPVWKTNVNAGIYVLDMRTKTLIEKDEYIDMPALIDRVKSEFGSVKIFPLHESWMDLGDVNVYARES